MNSSNLIKDSATRTAVKELETALNRLEKIQAIKVPDGADDTTRVIIQAINAITNSLKRSR